MNAKDKIKQVQKALEQDWLIHRDGFPVGSHVRAAIFDDRGQVVTLFVTSRNNNIEAQLVIDGAVIELNDAMFEALDRINVLRRTTTPDRE